MIWWVWEPNLEVTCFSMDCIDKNLNTINTEVIYLICSWDSDLRLK